MSRPPFFPHAHWIASGIVGGPRSMAPVPHFRRDFTVQPWPLSHATLWITALGVYECEINGRKVGDQTLSPGWTDFRKRVSYHQFDVTSLIQADENTIGVILGDGWYSGHVSTFDRQRYGDRPCLLAALELHYKDGRTEILGTNASWRTHTGPILHSDLLMGEAYDARLEMPGWSSPGFNAEGWSAALVMPVPEIELNLAAHPPVREVLRLTPVSAKANNQWGTFTGLYDFGQNFSGRAELTVTAPRGTTFRLRHAEILNPDGSLYLENLRTAEATDYYTCHGNGHEKWQPRFTTHGFRYLEVTAITESCTVKAEGIVLQSDTPITGHFACSNPRLNQLQSNIVWGQRSNFLEIPTDCPQRDERLGWTGDAQIFIRTACFNADVRTFFHKWLRDLTDGQRPSGGIPPVAPCVFPAFEDSGGGWADAVIICPWTLYLCYGDREILETTYPAMRRQMDFIATRRVKDFIRSHPAVDTVGGYGDWLALDGSGKQDGATPKDLIATAYYALDSRIMAKTATLLGYAEDAKHFSELEKKVTEAFLRRYVTRDGLLASGTQTAYVLALAFGLLPEELRTTATNELVRDIEARGNHIATGFIGTPYILKALEDHGRLDVAYRLLEQETFPSWIFPITHGATTIWERWDGWTPDKGFQTYAMNSFNHYAYGAVGAWMVQTVAGLELDENEPGYRHIIFRPRPGGSLLWAEASLKTAYGVVSIRWDRDNTDTGHFVAKVSVPEGTRATFVPPAGWCAEITKLPSGAHTIVSRKIGRSQ